MARITVAVIPAHRCLARAWVVLAVVVLTLGAGPPSTVRVDNWHAYPVGPLDLGAEWRRYQEHVRAQPNVRSSLLSIGNGEEMSVKIGD